jgi:hypothetical protein
LLFANRDVVVVAVVVAALVEGVGGFCTVDVRGALRPSAKYGPNSKSCESRNPHHQWMFMSKDLGELMKFEKVGSVVDVAPVLCVQLLLFEVDPDAPVEEPLDDPEDV